MFRRATLSVGLLAGAALLGLSACGGGGGGGGGGLETGPVDWGVPLTATAVSEDVLVTLHNLSAADAAVSIGVYATDGTLVGVAPVTLDPFDTETLTFAGTPTAGWALVHTPSAQVEVAFTHTGPSTSVDEASRAVPLGDLTAPPPSWEQAVSVATSPATLRVTNAAGAANVVLLTSYASPTTPGTDATAGASVAVPLDPYETAFVDPSTFGLGFVGQVVATSALPCFVVELEGGAADLAIDGVPAVRRRDRILHGDVAFGLDHAVPSGYTDFALVLTNTSDDPRGVELREVRAADGTATLLAPRSIGLGAHETRVVTTLDAPLDDLFGDATTFAFLVRSRLELFVPAEVDVAVRQYDPVFAIHVGTQRPQPAGHVVDVLGVETIETLPSLVLQWARVHNPSGAPITVSAQVVVPQPDGFDAAVTTLQTLTVPARGFVEFTVDGQTFLDRDGFAVDEVALRFTGAASFAVTGRRETRAANGLLTRWTSLITRSHDDAH